MGIYAIRDRASGHLLLGASRNVQAALNRARFGLAGVFWACPAAFLAMLVLHGLYYLHKEKMNGLFVKPGLALGAAGGRAPSA